MSWAMFSLNSCYTNLSMKHLVMSKVYIDVGGIKYLCHVCPHVRKIINSLKLVDYLHVKADNPWYNYYLISLPRSLSKGSLVNQVGRVDLCVPPTNTSYS